MRNIETFTKWNVQLYKSTSCSTLPKLMEQQVYFVVTWSEMYKASIFYIWISILSSSQTEGQDPQLIHDRVSDGLQNSQIYSWQAKGIAPYGKWNWATSVSTRVWVNVPTWLKPHVVLSSYPGREDKIWGGLCSCLLAGVKVIYLLHLL